MAAEAEAEAMEAVEVMEVPAVTGVAKGPAAMAMGIHHLIPKVVALLFPYMRPVRPVVLITTVMATTIMDLIMQAWAAVA